MKNQIFKLISSILFLASFLFLTPAFADEATTTPEIDTTASSTAVATTTTEIAEPTSTPAEDNTTSTPLTATLHLRYQNELIYSGTVTLPASTTITDNTGASFLTTSTNVLTALLAADNASDNFAVNNIQYYSAWNSFYLKCVIASSTAPTELCDNWNYVVGGNYPAIGMDQYLLQGNENIYIYFNNPWTITTPSSTVYVDATTSLKTWRYNFDDLENEWTADANSMIDISVPNPSSTGWWDTTLTVTTTTSNENGIAFYAFNATGTFFAKITSLDWSKWSWPITINVVDVPAPAVSTSSATTTIQENPPSRGGGGSGAGPTVNQKIDTEKAMNFLANHQQAGGSFGSSLYTDWAAMAMAAYSGSAESTLKIKQYLLTDPSSAGGLNDVSDNTRRAMALMSLGINPYSGVATNYIQHLTDAFDGTQFGDPNLFNDDIFALFPLRKAGFASTDPLIVSSTNFVLSKQNSNGSWGGVDLTAAAIQALALMPENAAVQPSLTRAKDYLRATQADNGSFDNNLFSTSWAVQAIKALGEAPDSWKKSNSSPHDFLLSRQATDGGMELGADNATRIWATSYALMAGLEKPWAEIMQGFNRAAAAPPSGSGTQSPTPSPSPTSTPTTTLISTTTPTIATSTLEQITGQTPTTTLVEIEVSTTPASLVIAEATNYSEPTPTQPSIIRPAASNKIKPVVRQIKPSSPPAVISPSAPERAAQIEQIVNELPLSTPLRNTAKKALAVSGGGVVVLGLYLGLKLIKII